MKQFFTADTHFGDKDLKIFRPTISTEEWDAFFLDKINSRVGRNDILYILGDFSESPNKYRSQIRCRNCFLIIGNHDNKNKCIKAFGNNKVYNYKTVRITGTDHRVWCCHYPTIFWDKSHKNVFHAYGHCHMAREDWLDQIVPERRSMDVSPENHWRLYGSWDVFAWDSIYNHLKNRKGHDNPLHYIKFHEEIYKDIDPIC